MGAPGLTIMLHGSCHNYPYSTEKILSCYLHLVINHVCHMQTLRLLLLHKVSISLIMTQILFHLGISMG
jgi:hypothetical protein